LGSTAVSTLSCSALCASPRSALSSPLCALGALRCGLSCSALHYCRRGSGGPRTSELIHSVIRVLSDTMCCSALCNNHCEKHQATPAAHKGACKFCRFEGVLLSACELAELSEALPDAWPSQSSFGAPPSRSSSAFAWLASKML